MNTPCSNTVAPLTAPAVSVRLDTLNLRDHAVRLASREGFFPNNGLTVNITNTSMTPNDELELLLDNEVIGRHIVTTTDAGAPFTMNTAELTEGPHEVTYRFKKKGQPYETCEQPAAIHVALKSQTDLHLGKAPSTHSGLFAQINISYPKDEKSAASSTTLANENITMVQGIQGLNLSRDATLLYFVQAKDSVSYVRAMDTRTQTIVHSYSPEVGGERLSGLLPDGTHAYINSPRSNYIWDANTQTHYVNKGADLAYGVNYMVMSPTGERLFACGTVDFTKGYLKVIDASTQTVVQSRTIEPWPYGIAINPTGSHLYLANVGDAQSDSDPTAIDVIDTQNLKTVARILVPGFAYSMALSADNQRLYVADFTASTILMIDTATHKIIGAVQSQRFPNHIVVSADGKHLYVTTQTSPFVWILDAESLAAVSFFNTEKNELREVLAKPDNGMYVLYRN
ncbi:YncE family protein [Pseudomonas arsenicoxydans]|uniref:YncE family protein n=1 Tax=Pseudomonas arsenicoxydans TaxID=702115 RepID=A0A502HKI5_9PSED|nr:YncE family protein [Pseudomonas arsenicoxydans]TPG73640.1 YncE family protein [Pseudomonas arsenicoxydans]